MKFECENCNETGKVSKCCKDIIIDGLCMECGEDCEEAICESCEGDGFTEKDFEFYDTWQEMD